MAETTLIATRESRIALWQAEHVRDLLTQRFGMTVALLGMTTRGDQILDRTLSKVGGKGLFVKELEAALEEGRAQLAVHSLKDVPIDLPEGFELAEVLEREDPRDAFVCDRACGGHAHPRAPRAGRGRCARGTVGGSGGVGTGRRGARAMGEQAGLRAGRGGGVCGEAGRLSCDGVRGAGRSVYSGPGGAAAGPSGGAGRCREAGRGLCSPARERKFLSFTARAGSV